MSDIANKTGFGELGHEHLTTAFDVHGAARAPMADTAGNLRGTFIVGATPNDGFGCG